MILDFLKMEGIGNDYVFLDIRDGSHCIEKLCNVSFIQRLCNRNYGIGSDGMVVIQRPQNQNQDHEAQMKMWNADGSPSSMCGNALRCIALHIFRTTKKEKFILESDTGNHDCKIISSDEKGHSAIVEVNMGKPKFLPSEIPFLCPQKDKKKALIDFPLIISETETYKTNMISMGNPHCIIFVDDPDVIELDRLGSLIENHNQFPEKTNVEFVSVLENGDFYQRTFERGSGETLACGSGACAVAVAGVLSGKGKVEQKIKLRGGELDLRWSGNIQNNSDVFMTGAARLVFQGKFICS